MPETGRWGEIRIALMDQTCEQIDALIEDTGLNEGTFLKYYFEEWHGYRLRE
jgi:hypothetical protein